MRSGVRMPTRNIKRRIHSSILAVFAFPQVLSDHLGELLCVNRSIPVDVIAVEQLPQLLFRQPEPHGVHRLRKLLPAQIAHVTLKASRAL